MTYALLTDGTIAEYPVYEGDIKLRFPDTSFTTPFVPPAGYVTVADTPQPQINWNQNIAEGNPALVDGAWTRTWVVMDATPEEITERTEARASGVRFDRNSRLASCDWTQLPDAPVDRATWAIYRQELRDVTAQAGFPWNITWPSKP